ncbi:hypothetical protein H8E65_11815 [Candidatus Bathyarchaeota archaeon]|nr:hypothetical protein [Candidatus Bathyarchaeota archaeon]
MRTRGASGINDSITCRALSDRGGQAAGGWQGPHFEGCWKIGIEVVDRDEVYRILEKYGRGG